MGMAFEGNVLMDKSGYVLMGMALAFQSTNTSLSNLHIPSICTGV